MEADLEVDRLVSLQDSPKSVTLNFGGYIEGIMYICIYIHIYTCHPLGFGRGGWSRLADRSAVWQTGVSLCPLGLPDL